MGCLPTRRGRATGEFRLSSPRRDGSSAGAGFHLLRMKRSPNRLRQAQRAVTSTDSRQRSPGRRLVDRLRGHYAMADRSHSARVIAQRLYGAIIVLAVLITGDDHSTRPLEAAIILGVTVAVLLGMEGYADVIARELKLHRSLTNTERVAAVQELLAVTVAAEAPLLFLVLAAAGVVSTELAFTLAKAATLGLLFHYGYVARRLAGVPPGRATAAGLAIAGIGAALAIGKGYVHF